jgi:putative acetyltransferase
MIEFRMSTSQDMPRVLDIWRRAVDATHDFLAPADRAAIDAAGVPQGFMFLHEGHLEALFIDPDHHGQGLGKALIERALVEHPNLTTDVNEQNPRALGFYERVGFERTGRSALDGQGRAYPLIHLRYRS